MTLILIILILASLILALTGILGAIIPAIPGPPLCWASLLTAYFACPDFVSSDLLWGMLALTILAQIVDYIAPIWMTKAGGGSKAAITGSTAGLILGFLFMPTGLILGPLVGAFIGEWLSTQQLGKAIKIALLSFISFLLSTGFKLALCLAMTYYTVAAFWHQLF